MKLILLAVVLLYQATSIYSAVSTSPATSTILATLFSAIGDFITGLNSKLDALTAKVDTVLQNQQQSAGGGSAGNTGSVANSDKSTSLDSWLSLLNGAGGTATGTNNAQALLNALQAAGATPSNEKRQGWAATASSTSTTPNPTKNVKCDFCRTCQDWYNKGDRKSQTRQLHPDGDSTYIKALCSYPADGGWMVIMQRSIEGHDNFDVGLSAYGGGVGSMCEQCGFWYRSDFVSKLTNRGKWHLRITLQHRDDSTIETVTYHDFKLENLANKYRLNVGNFYGELGNILNCKPRGKISVSELQGHNIPTPAILLTSFVNVGKGLLATDAASANKRTLMATDANTLEDECAVENKGAWWYTGKKLAATYSISYSPVSFIPPQTMKFDLPDFNANFCAMTAFTAKDPYYMKCNQTDPFSLSQKMAKRVYIRKAQMMIRPAPSG